MSKFSIPCCVGRIYCLVDLLPLLVYIFLLYSEGFFFLLLYFWCPFLSRKLPILRYIYTLQGEAIFAKVLFHVFTVFMIIRVNPICRPVWVSVPVGGNINSYRIGRKYVLWLPRFYINILPALLWFMMAISITFVYIQYCRCSYRGGYALGMQLTSLCKEIQHFLTIISFNL